MCSAAPGTQDDVGDVRGVRGWVNARLYHQMFMRDFGSAAVPLDEAGELRFALKCKNCSARRLRARPEEPDRLRMPLIGTGAVNSSFYSARDKQ